MVDHLKKMRKCEYQLDRYDNETFSKNPILKYRATSTKRLKRERRSKKVVSMIKCNFINVFLISIFFRILKSLSSIHFVRLMKILRNFQKCITFN